ncbi:MAG: biopolymer transporter ExbD [Bacteroidota bacterium]
MIHFKKGNPVQPPTIPTASLPDIVFILLFFFMTVTTIKDQNLLVENKLPQANETEKLTKTDRIIEVFVGHSKQTHGSSKEGVVQVQMDNRLVEMDDVGHQAVLALNNIPEHLRKIAIVSIKADHKVKMGTITDIKKQLKKVNLLKINYTTVEGDVFQNLKNGF